MNYISEGSVSHINGEVCSCSQMRDRRLSPLMVYYKTFGILTLEDQLAAFKMSLCDYAHISSF